MNNTIKYENSPETHNVNYDNNQYISELKRNLFYAVHKENWFYILDFLNFRDLNTAAMLNK